MGNKGAKPSNGTDQPGEVDPKDYPELPDSLDTKYEIGDELGRGAFSIVKKAVKRETGQKFAIKFIGKKFVTKEELHNLCREIDIMKRLAHENVMKLYEYFDTDDLIALVLELVPDGELFYKIVEVGNYSELDAQGIVRQIVQGITYLHKVGIAHRDLKPENLLCDKSIPKHKPFRVVIADFGLSKFFDENNTLETRCGTPDYVAPEVIAAKGSYSNAIDMWATGVITYVLLCGYSPFLNDSDVALFAQIVKADYDFPEAEWRTISENAKDFIRKLLIVDAKKRMSAEEAMRHPWLAANMENAEKINITTKLNAYNQQRKLSKQSYIEQTVREELERSKKKQEEQKK